MAKNAADLLIEFFDASYSGKGVYEFPHLWSAVMEIESHVTAWAALGQQVSAFRNTLKEVKKELMRSVNVEFEAQPTTGREISDGDMGVLLWISEKLDSTTPGFDEQQKEQVRSLLTEVKATLVDDATLPDDLRLHIARLILHTEECLEEWAIKGDFVLADALDRLMGAVRIAEAKSTKSEVWENLWKNWIRPIAVGLVVAVATNGLELGSMLSIANGPGLTDPQPPEQAL